MVFAGFLGHTLIGTLRRTGVVKDRPVQPMQRRAYPAFLIGAALMATLLGVYLRGALRSPTIAVGGRVDAPYTYPQQHGDLPTITAGPATARYTGVPIRELIARARPQADAELLLVQATDGYAFFISMKEVQENDDLLLASQGKGNNASYDIVGARNNKAKARGVNRLTLIPATTLEITGALGKPAPFNPDEWQFQMDSTTLDVGNGPQKLQGASLAKVLQTLEPLADATTVILHTDGNPVTLPLRDVMGSDDVRIFTVVGADRISFAVAQMSGIVIAPQIIRIEVK